MKLSWSAGYKSQPDPLRPIKREYLIVNGQYAIVLTVRARRLLVKRPMLQLRRLAECLFVPPRAFRRPVGSVKFTVHLPTLLLAMSPLLNTTKALFGL